MFVISLRTSYMLAPFILKGFSAVAIGTTKCSTPSKDYHWICRTSSQSCPIANLITHSYYPFTITPWNDPLRAKLTSFFVTTRDEARYQLTGLISTHMKLDNTCRELVQSLTSWQHLPWFQCPRNHSMNFDNSLIESYVPSHLSYVLYTHHTG